MKEKSENMKLIESYLQKIDYSIRHRGCGYWYIIDHNKKETEWFIFGDEDTRIERNPDVSFQYSVCFHLKDCDLYAHEQPEGNINCVGIGAKGSNSVFLQFYNNDK